MRIVIPVPTGTQAPGKEGRSDNPQVRRRPWRRGWMREAGKIGKKDQRGGQAEQHGEARPHQRREPYCRALPRGFKSITASIRVGTVVLLKSASGFDVCFPSLFPLFGVACCRCHGMDVSCVKLTPLLWRGLQQR